MGGSTPNEAFEQFIGSLRAAMECVTQAALIADMPYPTDRPHGVAVGQPPARLGRGGELALTVLLDYRVVEESQDAAPWQVRTTRYAYVLTDHSEREVVAYYWNSEAGGSAHEPYLFIGKGLVLSTLPARVRAFVGRVTNARWPTGLVPLPALLRSTIADLGVEPLLADRAEVDRILAAAERVMNASLAWALES